MARGANLEAVLRMMDLESDRRLTRGAASGDQKAWQEVYDRTCQGLFALLCYQVGKREEALDLLQETYLQAFRRLDQFRGDAPLEVWLRKIALRKALDWKRAWRRRGSRNESLPDDLPAADPPTETLQFRTERAAVMKALSSISDVQRAVFLLREWEGMSFREVAEAVGCEEATARVHYARARAKLRDRLAHGPLGDQREMGDRQGAASGSGESEAVKETESR